MRGIGASGVAMSAAAAPDAVRLRGGGSLPLLGLGTMHLRGSLCEEMVANALRLGFRLVDTASMYGNEREVGAALVASGVPRAELRVVSKLRPEDMGYDSTLKACAASCAALGVGYLDAYLVHAPGGSRRKRLETWRAMEALLAEGTCRAIGVSNYHERHIREIEAEPTLSTLPHLNQCEFNPVCQQHELRAFCAERSIAWMAHTPFGGRGAPLLRDGRLQPACRHLSASPSQVHTPPHPSPLLIPAEGFECCAGGAGLDAASRRHRDPQDPERRPHAGEPQALHPRRRCR